LDETLTIGTLIVAKRCGVMAVARFP